MGWGGEYRSWDYYGFGRSSVFQVSRICILAMNGSLVISAAVLCLEVLAIFLLSHIQVASCECGIFFKVICWYLLFPGLLGPLLLPTVLFLVYCSLPSTINASFPFLVFVIIQVTLYDTGRRLLDSRFLKKDEVIGSGESLALDGHLVDIGEPEGDHRPPEELKVPGRNCTAGSKTGFTHGRQTQPSTSVGILVCVKLIISST